MKYVYKDGIVKEFLDEQEIVLLDTLNEQVHILNRTSTEVYLLLNSLSEQEVIDKMIENYVNNGEEINNSEIINDIENLISEFVKLGVIDRWTGNE